MAIRTPGILVVDDDVDLCFLLSSVLKQKNFHVSVAYSLSEAEQYLQEEGLGIIFLDHYLPDGLSTDFIPKIRAVNKNIKIIIITADPSRAMGQQKLGEDNVYFLSKPFSLRSLEDVLNTVLI